MRQDHSSEAETQLAEARTLQALRSAELARRRSTLRRLMAICIPIGGALWLEIAFLVQGPALAFAMAGAGCGCLAAALLARVAG